MKLNDYFRTLFDDKQIKILSEAIKNDERIIITGKQGVTGKTTLVNVLKKLGANVVEVYDSCSIVTLNKIIDKKDRIPTILNEIDEIKVK